MKFKVWCLSWDDTEDDDCSVEHGRLGDSVVTRRTIIDWQVTCAESAAEVYAYYCHDNRDGWEETWPLVFRVRSEDGTEQDFEVDREAVPQFTAKPAKRSEEKR